MTQKKWLYKYFSLILLIGIFFFNYYSFTSAEQNEIDINITLNGYLFNVDNLKPGDWMTEELTVLNDGKQNFKYTAMVGETKSYKGLLEELLLLVKKDTFVLFDGKLKDFKGLNPRVLSKGSQETLFFQVTMPYELGNEFQASAAEIEIIFYAEGITNTPPSCQEDPSQVGCEQPPSCEEDPTQAGCEQPPSCEENPTQEGCEPQGENPEDPGDEDENPVPGDKPVEPNTGSPDITDVVVIPKDVNHLPNTTTNNYNLLLAGGILLGGGSILLLFNRRRNRRDN